MSIALPLLISLTLGIQHHTHTHVPAPAPTGVPAGVPTDADADAPGAEAEESAANFHWRAGPATVALGHDLTVQLPAGDLFLASPEAGKLLERAGGFHNENLLGVIVAQDDERKWLVTLRYTEEGYVKDGEKIDGDELLKALREGTEEGNKERQEKGFPPLHVVGWAEPPRYEKETHHLVWAARVKSDGAQQEDVNFNTRILGRKGYLSLNLVTPMASLEADKSDGAALLAVTSFDSGARYQDFQPKTDKVAEYGLGALVLGGAALKLGLFAKAGNFLIAGLLIAKKFLVIALAAGASLLRRLFGKKGGPPPADPQPEPPPSA